MWGWVLGGLSALGLYIWYDNKSKKRVKEATILRKKRAKLAHAPVARYNGDPHVVRLEVKNGTWGKKTFFYYMRDGAVLQFTKRVRIVRG